MANDGKAKAVLKKYLHSRDHKILNDTENYSWDLSTLTPSGCVSFWEVEIKNQWGKVWNDNWKEVRIPQRKQRLIDKFYHETNNAKEFAQDNNLPEFIKPYQLTFVVLNRHLDQGWFIPHDVLEISPVQTIQNSRHVDAPHLKEPFFHVDVKHKDITKLQLDRIDD
tara:strand:+ start:6007 stop:6504 length:498 start_codon:yes stop_codon:yes gene_type:complete